MELCPLHDEDNPRTATAGLLCTGHADRLTADIADMASLYDALLPAHTAAAGGPKVSGTREKQIPYRDAPGDARADITGRLISWCRLIAEERGVTAPRSAVDGRSGTAEGEDTNAAVSRLSAWLSTHLDWCLEQPWVDEMARELRDTSRRAFNVAYPTGRHRFTVHECVEDGCTGQLIAYVADADDQLPATLACTVNAEHVYTADKWLTLGRRIVRQEAS